MLKFLKKQCKFWRNLIQKNGNDKILNSKVLKKHCIWKFGKKLECKIKKKVQKKFANFEKKIKISREIENII